VQAVSSVLATLASSLEERRTPDAGFAAVPGGSPDSESTALAALARQALALGTGDAVGWIAARQRPDGAWPLTDAVAAPSWASAWAALALARSESGSESLARAARWLVAREGRRPGLLPRALGRLTGQHERLEQDLTLRGWPWHEAAASWVEPTASALLALRVLETRAPVAGARERIEEGERLLWDRACVKGGWNYGNRRVLGEALEPFPDTTALALLALQGSARREALAEGCDALERLLDEKASSLALALAALALELHARDAAPLRVRLEARVERIGPPRETRSIAFALLALTGGAELLRVPS
jgi:hypothetical protein